MRNTNAPLTDAATHCVAEDAAKAKARCDYAIFVGGGTENSTTAAALAGETAGLKLYLDQTFGPLRLDDLVPLQGQVAAWPKERPLAAHAEGRSLAAVLLLAHLRGRPQHICHVSRKDEILLIRAAQAG